MRAVDYDRRSKDMDGAGIGLFRTRKHANQSRLTGAILTRDRMRFAACEGQAHISERSYSDIVLRESTYRQRWLARTLAPSWGAREDISIHREVFSSDLRKSQPRTV